MKNIPINIFRKIQQLSEEVQLDLKKKGIVVPIKNNDGSVSIGKYKIIKNNNGYSIVDTYNEIVVDKINLPQSAVLIANRLALGKFKDDLIIDSDRRYGYALFEEELHNKAVSNSKKKTLEYFDLMSTKAAIAKSKKETYKRDLLSKYEKLIQLV